MERMGPGLGSGLPPGCLALIFFLGLLVLIPFFLANAVLAALSRLGLGPESALLVAAGIFLGGAVNLPVMRIPREVVLEVPRLDLFGLRRLSSRLVVRRSHTVVAVNVGGCLVPAGLAAYQVVRLAGEGGAPLVVAASAVGVNTAVCWWLARPVEGVGITLPALVPAVTAALCGLFLAPEHAPAVAFTAGVLGPLLGADLLHLKDVARIATGMASIGGAGTFDGIVLSGLVATLLA